MQGKFEPVDLKKIKTYSLKERKNKVSKDDFASVYQPGMSFTGFLETLPSILVGNDFRDVVKAIGDAYINKKMVVVSMGAHVIKCGMNPIIIDLMEKGIFSSIAINGAGVVHDVETALAGQTSENVSEGISGGKFGTIEETGAFINRAASDAQKNDEGYGWSLGKKLIEEKAPFADLSILAAGWRLGVPVTVHLAMGTDINHMHPMASGSALGEATFYDFRLFASVVSKVREGSVVINIGSAVVLPVVFEKALNIARNLGNPVEKFTGVNMDFLSHYRSNLNPIQRAKDLGGKGYELIGRHEIMVPLLAAAVKEYIDSQG